MTSVDVENELDIRGLCCALWRGKLWIVALAVLFAVVAWSAALFMKQAWSTTATTDRPTVNMLGNYYGQQQFLNNLDARSNTLSLSTPAPTIMDEVYQEFITQLSSWDTRRDFWLQTDYYKSRKSGNNHKDAALLNELISNIIYTPADAAHNTRDNIKLVAESATDANNLLRQYVAWSSERAARHLNDELNGAWQARSALLQSQVERQDRVAQAVFQRREHLLEQAVKVASQQGIRENRSGTTQLSDNDLFMLGEPALRAQLEDLQASGPDYDITYDQNRAMLASLQAGSGLDKLFQTYRYLRTPEEPVTRDSPRTLFMAILWGAVGALIGSGVALARRARFVSTPRR